MSAWGVGILENDVADEIYNSWITYFELKWSAASSRKRLEEYHGAHLNNPNDMPDFWFALAQAQWEIGNLDPDVLARVEALISDGKGIERWESADESIVKERRAVLSAFLTQLRTPNPQPRTRTPPVRVPRKLPYKEGDWMSIPLKRGGYALGIAARTWKGGGILGYFFGPRRDTIPSAADTEGLAPSDAFLIAKVGDLGLLLGLWTVVHRPSEWRREDWPKPDFGRFDCVNPSIAERITYDDNNLDKDVCTRRVSVEEARSLPEDGTHGYLSLSNYLDHLLP